MIAANVSVPLGLRRELGTPEAYAALVGILIGAGSFKLDPAPHRDTLWAASIPPEQSGRDARTRTFG